MKPEISVIIPAHNEEKYIERSLNSLDNQTFKNFETIVVANGCSDNTIKILQEKNVNHIVIDKANVCLARNIGAKNSIAKKLLFLDADTKLPNNAIEKILNCKSKIITTKIKPDSNKLKFILAMKFKSFYLKYGLYPSCSGILACHKLDFENVLGYNENRTVREHNELIKKLLKFGDYKCINSTVITSMRRYHRWGVTKITKFWINQWIKEKLGKKNNHYEHIN